MSLMTIEEITETYDRYIRQIYAFFSAKFLNKQVAEDLTSETFMIFVKQAKKQIEIENIQAYLFGIAKRVFFQHLRKKYSEPHTSYSDNDDFAAYVSLTAETAQTIPLEKRVMVYLEKLPDKQRIVINLRLIEKYSLHEIALKLGKDMNYVKTTQKRAIKNLRQMIACTP